MQRDELLQHVVRLGRAFTGRGMEAHARMLRLYYLALRHGLASPRQPLRLSISADAVIEWLKTLRVPPFEATYPVRPRGTGCASCRPGGQAPMLVTEVVFPGGARMRCNTCGAVWLEQEPPDWRMRRPATDPEKTDREK
jgi:hypothetical protein